MQRLPRVEQLRHSISDHGGCLSSGQSEPVMSDDSNVDEVQVTKAEDHGIISTCLEVVEVRISSSHQCPCQRNMRSMTSCQLCQTFSNHDTFTDGQCKGAAHFSQGFVTDPPMPPSL